MSLLNFFTARLPIKASVFAVFCSITCTLAQEIYVSSRNNHSVKRYDLDGNFLGDFVAANSGGLFFPQEVAWHPDGFLLVTGRGNTAVKKYDGASGAYLGNFTSGYALDNPTKTTIWEDSLLYVSQWGTTKNKVVRFDLKTGAFVDEFTSTGVPNGCGHAWDAAGNLLVAQYGDGANGRVYRFNPEGVLIDIFIPTTILQGPVNLWFDAENNLFVADWTLGDVLKFNGETGAFLNTVVNGLANVEGFAFDDSGALYLCDWTANRVFKYDFTTNSLTSFITSGGLQAPNSILIRGVVSAGKEVETAPPFQLSVSPNPAGSFVQIDYFLKKSATVQVEVLYDSGQKVATVFSGNQSAGKHQLVWEGSMVNGLKAQAGVYFVRFTIDKKTLTKPLVWK